MHWSRLASIFCSLWFAVAKAEWNETIIDEINEIPDELDPKIVNGREAKEAEFPWMVALHYNNRFICSASLISDTLVLTAAHCVELRDNGPEPANAFYGIVGNVSREGADTLVRFREVVTHPDYATSGGETGDIAIFRTTQPVSFTDLIQPICLTSAGREFDGQQVQAVGWGLTSTNARDPPETLMTTTLRVLEPFLCRLFFKFFLISLSERHVCANAYRATGVCFGDSGGPLVYQDQEAGKPITIGVAAFITMFGCGKRFLPNVYTAVAEYNDWIMTTVGNDAGVCFV